jgi:phage protein D
MSTTILDIELARNNFYAPAFKISVAGQNLVRNLELEITSVSVDKALERADHFTFVVNNAFDISKREFLKVDNKTMPEFFEVGTPIEISMGYGDHRTLDIMLQGIVTEVRTSFPSSGLPQLTISGYDHSYPLTRGTDSKPYDNQTDSSIVREIASEFHLDPKVDDTAVVQPRTERSQENAKQFVMRLARRNGFEFFVTPDKELYFRKPANNERAVIELEWGRGLLTFSPEINLAEQVTQVEVFGWDVQNKRQIVGRARSGDEPGRDSGRRGGAEYLEKICSRSQGKLRVREPIFSQQEADARARAIFKDRAERFITGHGESIGIPELKPNANVKFGGLGRLFNKAFYIEQATHSVDSSGYRTSFQVKEPTI